MAWWVLDSLLAGDGHAIFVQPKGQLSVAYFCRNEHTKCPFCIQALCLKKKANKVYYVFVLLDREDGNSKL